MPASTIRWEGEVFALLRAELPLLKQLRWTDENIWVSMKLLKGRKLSFKNTNVLIIMQKKALKSLQLVRQSWGRKMWFQLLGKKKNMQRLFILVALYSTAGSDLAVQPLHVKIAVLSTVRIGHDLVPDLQLNPPGPFPLATAGLWWNLKIHSSIITSQCC